MIKIQGAVIKERGVTFAITVVKYQIFNSEQQCQEAALSFSSLFPGMPIVLMAQDSRGIPSYWGRRDIVNFLSRIHPAKIHWKEYTFS
jgi:hypothetical protein